MWIVAVHIRALDQAVGQRMHEALELRPHFPSLSNVRDIPRITAPSISIHNSSTISLVIAYPALVLSPHFASYGQLVCDQTQP